MMVETMLECSQDFAVGGALPQWKRELLARRALRRPAPAPPPPAVPAPPPLPPADDEELRYGPGIVNRLRSRYLSLALRVSPPRPTVLRRATSLEHLLDEPSAAPPPPRAPRAAPAVRRELVKRARSVDALSRVEAPCAAPRAARPPRRPAPLLRDTERPPPDVVRSTRSKFEGSARRSTGSKPPDGLPGRYTLTAARRSAQLPPLAAANPVLLRRVGVIRPMPPTPPPLPATPPPTTRAKADRTDLIIDLAPDVTLVTDLPPKPEIPAKPELIRSESHVKEPLIKADSVITVDLKPEPPVACERLEPIDIERIQLDEAKPEPKVERPISPNVKAKDLPISPIAKAKHDRPISPVAKAKERPITPIEKVKERPISPITKVKELPLSPIAKPKERPISPITKPKLERPVSPAVLKPVSNGVESAVTRRRPAPPPAVGAVSVVFNFSARNEVPDYIENDGLVLRAARRGTHKGLSGDGGGLSSDEETSESDGVDSHCSPVRFVNDNVLMNNRSSLLQPARKHKVRHAKLRLQFDDSLTRTFEYPSETSLCVDDLDAPSPAAPAAPPAQADQHAANHLAANTHIASAALSRYTPSKMSPDPFQLGVTRAPPPTPPGPKHTTEQTNGTAAGCLGADDGADAVQHDQCETERAFSQARLPNTDLLF